MQAIKELKAKVQEFLETEFDEKGEYGSLENTMFHSEYPQKDSKWNGDFENAVLAKAEELGLEVNYEDSYDGEGMDEDYWSVYSFADGTNVVYVKFDGWYAPYHGSEFNEYFFVTPKEVTVVQFEKEND